MGQTHLEGGTNMEWILIMFCIINMLIGLMILRFVSKPKEPYFDVSDEYQKQLKSYRSIVRSNEKIIRELKKKEETKNEQDMVQVTEQRRVY